MPLPRTESGRQGWASLLADPAAALIALDYDGTLAPIMPRPQDAVPQPGALDALVALAGAVGQVALVTGRPAEVVLALGGFAVVPGLVVLGQYGVQRWRAGLLEQEPPAPGLELVRRRLPELVAGPGIEIEDKGLSLVVHTRRAPDPVEALARAVPLLTALAEEAEVELHPGRLVLELRPAGFDKGRALGSLCRGVSTVLYAGDDRGDVAAFDELDQHRELDRVLVCSDSEEAPEELRARADLVVPGPAGVVTLLRELASSLG